MHASIAIVHGGSEATSACSLARATLGRRRSTCPVSFTPCSANTFLTRSMPTVTIAMDFPFSNELMRHSHFPSWHFVAGRRNTRLVRDGEVPFIR